MQICIANKLAALKQGTSFEYVSENRLFSGSDGYTLTITFPLKDCPQNQKIFGHINRADVSAGKVVFDCEIRDKSFYRFGCITITEINEAEVKTQFLDGRSEQNFDMTFDKVYINELDLGAPSTTSKSGITPSEAFYVGYHPTEVCLPWVNNASGNIQNCISFDAETGVYSWHTDTKGLSWQLYLIEATRRICKAIGYTCDLTDWEDKEEYNYLLICNTLPFSWYTPEYARALPHWTVEEYFEKLELFLGCEFDFDHRTKNITFRFSKDVLETIKPVRLDKVVSEHSTEVKVEDAQCEYTEAKNLVYKDCDHNQWKYYSCDWFIKTKTNYCAKYDTMAQLLAAAKPYATWSGSNYRGAIIDKVLYAADVDCWFAIRAVSRVDTGQRKGWENKEIVWEYTCKLQPLNLFGGRIVDEAEDADEQEIEFVPAWIDYTDDTYGWALFLSFSGYDEESTGVTILNRDPDQRVEERNNRFAQSSPIQSLEAGEKDKKAEYYDSIYIGWWDGAMDSDMRGKLPHPYVENIIVNSDWSNYRLGHFNLRLNDNVSRRSLRTYNIDPKKKFTFKWISDTIPNVRSLFIIRGKRYICEKITATFTENGMSQLLKGVFYEVI